MKLTWTERREWRCDIGGAKAVIYANAYGRFNWYWGPHGLAGSGVCKTLPAAKRAVARWAKANTRRATAKGAK